MLGRLRARLTQAENSWNWAGALQFTLAVLVLTAAAMLLVVWLTPAVDPESLRQGAARFYPDLFPNRDPWADPLASFRPEPWEMRGYFAALIVAPITAFLLSFTPLGRRAAPDSRPFWPIAILLMLLAYGALCLLIEETVLMGLVHAVRNYAWTLGAALALLGLWVLHRRGRIGPVPRILLQATLTILLILSLGWRIYGLKDVSEHAVFAIHLDTLLYGYAEAINGAVCLADYRPQYGCQSLVFAVLPTELRPGFDGLVLYFFALVALALIGLIGLCFRHVKDPVLAVAAALLIAATLGRFAVAYGMWDPMFQNNPGRLLFPVLAALLAERFTRRPSLAGAAGFGLIAGLGLLWNVESGLAVSIAGMGLFLLLAVADLLRRGQMGGLVRFGGFAVVLAATLLGAWGLIGQLHGSPPDLGAMFYTQNAFFGLGYFMLPLPVAPAGWHLLMLIYGGALAMGIRKSLRHSASPALLFDLFLALLGSCLFVYYLGRSHALNLPGVAWPAILIAARWAVQMKALAGQGLPGWAVRVPQACFIIAGIAAASLIAPSTMADRARTATIGATAAGALPATISEIERWTRPEDSLLYLGPHQAAVYLETGHRAALGSSSLYEMLLTEDFERLKAAILKSPPDVIVLSNAWLEGNLAGWARGALLTRLMAQRKVYFSPDGELTILSNRPFPAYVPAEFGRRNGWRGLVGRLPDGDLTLAMMMDPSALKQSQTILSTGPSWPHGLELTADAGSARLRIGDGRQVAELATVSWPAGTRRVHLALRRKGEQLSLFLNGVSVKTADTARLATYSAGALIRGANPTPAAPAAGRDIIAAVTVLDNALADADIARQAEQALKLGFISP